MKKLLQELANSKLIKVTGSYADGTQKKNSDIDFYLKPDNPEWKFLGLERNITKIIKILNKHKIKWGSETTGYIHTHNIDFKLPIPIEINDLFNKRKNKLKSVNIFGVEFKTY